MINFAALAVLLGLTVPQTEALVATHVSDADITTVASAAPEGRVTDDSIRLVDAGGIQRRHRNSPTARDQSSERHSTSCAH